MNSSAIFEEITLCPSLKKTKCKLPSTLSGVMRYQLCDHLLLKFGLTEHEVKILRHDMSGGELSYTNQYTLFDAIPPKRRTVQTHLNQLTDEEFSRSPVSGSGDYYYFRARISKKGSIQDIVMEFTKYLEKLTKDGKIGKQKKKRPSFHILERDLVVLALNGDREWTLDCIDTQLKHLSLPTITKGSKRTIISRLKSFLKHCAKANKIPYSREDEPPMDMLFPQNDPAIDRTIFYN